MNDNDNRPTHEAARVVIPFDIDLKAVEQKIEQLENRLKTLSQIPQQAQNASPLEQAQQTQSHTGNDTRLVVVALNQVSEILMKILDLAELMYLERNGNGSNRRTY